MALEPLVATPLGVGLLAFEEQREAVLEDELGDVGHGGLLVDRPGDAGEPEFVGQVQRGLSKRNCPGTSCRRGWRGG